MDKRVRSALLLIAAALGLFIIADAYPTVAWIFWIRAASAGLALAGLIRIGQIAMEEFKARK